MGKSSKDKRDAYYRLAKEQNWRARSAFKLIQLDEQFDLFSHDKPEQCTRVVDLCAAPGSWSQVLSRVLTTGESFGRREWMEKMDRLKRRQARLNQQKAKALAEGREDLGLACLAREASDDSDDDKRAELKPRENVKIVAIDLQPMAPLPGIIQLKADITHPSTVPLLLKALDPDWDATNSAHRVDLVISDGAPDVTGLHDLDIYVQAQLLYSALSLAMKVLRPGGKFVAKIFRGRNVDLIYTQLKLVFERVHVAKPRSSRASSLEAFVVCEGYTPIDDTKPPTTTTEATIATDDNPVSTSDTIHPTSQPSQTRIYRPDGVTELHFNDEPKDPKRWIAPFLACGDLSAWDSDATYKLPPDYVSLPPVQPPTAPPYKEAIERRRMEGGLYGKTKNANRGKTAARAENQSKTEPTADDAEQTVSEQQDPQHTPAQAARQLDASNAGSEAEA